MFRPLAGMEAPQMAREVPVALPGQVEPRVPAAKEAMAALVAQLEQAEPSFSRHPTHLSEAPRAAPLVPVEAMVAEARAACQTTTRTVASAVTGAQRVEPEEPAGAAVLAAPGVQYSFWLPISATQVMPATISDK